MENKQPAEVTEEIAEQIKVISEGVSKLLNGKLNRKAIILLIYHAAPSMKREKQLKTGFGRQYLRNRLKNLISPHSSTDRA